ncbi:Magnetosome protein MamA [uncultured bacterium]|nr:Magnetosome protein MamA [uncultured bacterium]
MKRCASLFLLFLLAAGPAFSEDVNPLSLGISDYRDESYEEAIDSLKEARQAQPSSFEAALYLGLSYKAIQDFTEARAQLAEAARLRPASAEARLSLAETLYHLGEYEAAEREIDAVDSKGFRPGDVRFLKGLVFMKTGRTEEAVASFRAAKAVDGSLSQSADYHAALAYMNASRYDEALGALKEAVVNDPSTDLAEYAREYSRSIEKKKEREKPLKLSAGLRLEYDDNVILKPADAAAAAGMTGEGDFREVLTFRADHARTAKGPWSLKASWSLYAANQHSLETHEVISNKFSVTPAYNYTEGSAAVSIIYSNSLVENALYLDSLTVQPSWSRTLGPSSMVTFSGRLQKREYHQEPFSDAEDRDSVDYGISAAYHRFLGNGGFWSLRYELNREETDGANWEYEGKRASVNVLYPLQEAFKLQAFAEWLVQDFSNANSFFFVEREDKVFTASLLASYAVAANADLMVQYTHVRDDSNIAIYDYERNIYSAGIDYRF